MEDFDSKLVESLGLLLGTAMTTTDERNLEAFPVPPLYETSYSYKNEQTLYLNAGDIVRTCQHLKANFDFEFLMDLCGVDYPDRSRRFEIVYHLFSYKNKRRLRIKVALADDESIESVYLIWPGANWFERECFDMYGVKFVNHPDLRRILCHTEFVGHPLRKDYPADKIQSMSGAPIEHLHEADKDRLMNESEDDLMWINIGPAHPATHGTLRFMAVIDGGEKIKEFDCEIGYLHRCFEKMCENHNYNQIIPYTDRLNYCSAPANNNCFASTVEKMLGVTIPPRAIVIRMILDELSRIIDHFVCIGTNAVDLGALTGFFYLFNERENVYSLFEKLCGARLTVSLTRIGGQGFDLPTGWISDLETVLKSIEKTHFEIDSLLSNNKIFVQRTRGAGPISQADAIGYGFTGVCLRATGHSYDLRRDQPYYFYSDIDFQVAVGSAGDTYDRYLVRMEEVKQSIKMIRWCIKNLPAGPVCLSDRKVCLPNKSEVYGNIEGLMNHFMLIINGVQVPAGYIYHAQESPNGELGFYIVSDGSGTPYRVKCRPPSFATMSGFHTMVKKGYLADAIAALGSINIIAGELDR